VGSKKVDRRRNRGISFSSRQRTARILHELAFLNDPIMDSEQQFRLRLFWGQVVFSLGILWGVANIVYCPVAAMTSIVGSSWLEVAIVLAGGLLATVASIQAFYRRISAARTLLFGGIVLLLVAFAGQFSVPDFGAHGAMNLTLLFLSGSVACSLGLFGWITDLKGWPALRSTRAS
jgi:hypothetical protein